VREHLGTEATSGDRYLFVSRDRTRAKVLFWDGTGLCVYAKRLEQGR
jgi:transposase